MIKGPKAILSSAIAGALGEYFVVDESSIESKLLGDARIVLRNVALKELTTKIPVNSAGKSTRITTTGCVDEVSFSWAWSVGETAWVNDAVLTITGARFRAALEHVGREEEGADEGEPAVAAENVDRREAFVNPATIDQKSAREIQKQKGGVSGFVERQVKMIIDSLTLKMINFELQIVLPPASTPQSAGGVDISCTSACERVFSVGANKIEVQSFGRCVQDEDAAPESTSKLKQRINLHSFACGVRLEGAGAALVSYPLVEPFSYSADVVRLGERFGGFMTGLQVTGLGMPSEMTPDLPSPDGSGLSFHMGTVQFDSLMQLSVMVLAPPDDSVESSGPGVEDVLESSETEGDADISSSSDPSSFHFPLSSVSLVLFDETRFVVSGITTRYRADGTVCSVEAEKMEYMSDAGNLAIASQVLVSMRPSIKMRIGCIETLQIAETMQLVSPIQKCEINYEGNTVSMRLDRIDVVTFSKTEEAGPSTGPTIVAPKLPFNMDLLIENGMQIKKSEDGSLSKFGRFHMYALEEKGCVRVATQFESYKTPIFTLSTVSSCGTLPHDKVDTVNDFIFTAGAVVVKSGHSTDEWEDAVRPRKQKVKRKDKLEKSKKEHVDKVKQSEIKKGKDAGVIKLPFATLSDMKITIAYKASSKLGRVKDTTLVIKAYNGKAETTSKELTNYYARACLSRAPDFISNAEVLGLNIVDSTAGLLSTWAGMGLGLGSAFGAGTGVAAVTAVDAIKGAVDAGKRSRNVSEGDNWKPGDFLRGLVQAAGEATRDGVAIRGKQGGGNIIDWAVGATSNTTDYVVDNKNKLGAAGAGGGGFLLGMALGGPVGAVIGGLVATATAGVTLERLDEMGERIEDSKEEKKREELTKKNTHLMLEDNSEKGTVKTDTE